MSKSRKDHRDEVELDGLPLARVADGGMPHSYGADFSAAGLARAEELRGEHRSAGKCEAETDHDQKGMKPAIGVRTPGISRRGRAQRELVLRKIKQR
jgi:hypothetical protein